MGYLAAINQLFTTPITFFEHEGAATAQAALEILNNNGVQTASMIDRVVTEEWGESYVIGVYDYDKAIKVLRTAGIL